MKKHKKESSKVWSRIIKKDKDLVYCFDKDFGEVIVVDSSNKLQPRGMIFNIFKHILQLLGLYISNNSANFLFQGLSRLGLLCADKRPGIISHKIVQRC